MDFSELARQRFSVRKFKKTAVPQECIDKIIEAGYVAPTACNLQPQKILVLNEEEALKKFRRCTECHFNAPLVFIVCYDKTKCWKRCYDGKTSGDIDASIVATHMMLEAQSLSIGSTWVMHFIPEAIKMEFEFPDNLEPVAVLTMGYAAEDAVPAPGHGKFRELSEIVAYNEW